ncbi:type VI lipase adapter Tla3 domain-containing protein [Ralstonia pseudosolanacearum]|uniref:type VI lipase adapter Tla3 domain-containing protein n=1 Tax=Ralstonia pseudosolanacearum TaxID=1310165 RepID=UPI003D029B74
MVRRKPKLWPYATAFALAALLWTLHVMAGYYEHWQATGTQAPDMGISIRNGVLAAAGIAVALYGAGFAWMQLGASRAMESGAAQAATPAAASPHDSARAAMLAQTGQRFVLEVRGVGVVAGPLTNIEIWKEVEAKANNHVSYLSTDPNDYPASPDDQLDGLRLAEGTAFEDAARKAVEYWPVPVIVWEAPRDRHNSSRPAASIMSLRQQASLGVTLFLWEADANTDDGAAMVQKLFDFFDAHPDVPSALIVSTDGTLNRQLLRAPGSGRPSDRYRIPDMPDSVGAILVSRSDRVDRLIRPFAVEQTANVNKDTTDYDITKLWNFYWKTNNDRSPDSFAAHYRKQQQEDTGDEYPTRAVVSSDWWIKRLPDLWRDINNKGPGQFTPSPYIPVRWTTWQVKAFDEAPLLGYWHRPIDIKLIDAHGKPLRGPEQAEALKAGWDKALATLPEGEKPKRVFYDTTGDKQWVIPLTQAFALVGPSAPQLGDVKEGYDIGARIANTGVSSPLVQVGLGLIAGYVQGGASATINRRPNGIATITMVSPPDAATKAAWVQQHGKADPFGGVHPLD